MKRNLILLLFSGLCAVSCTKAVIQTPPDKSGVIISLDWTGKEIPGGMKFSFYSVDGTTGSLIQVDGPADAYRGELAPGHYRVLAYNTDVTGVTFSGMDSYRTATVAASAAATRADGVTLISQPSLLYAGTMATELEVSRFDVVETSIVPRQLSKSLKLTFLIRNLSGVNKIEGELYGLYSSVLLSTGEATEEARKEAPQVGTCFTAEVVSGNPTVNVIFLGMLSPDRGETYKNEMPITLKGKDGWQQETKVDLSRVLTDIVSKGDNEFEFEIEDNIEISVEPTPVGLSAQVLSWTRNGTGEGEISYIIYN